MPIYTYRCQSCGIEVTKTQSFSASPLRQCPKCHSGQVRRVLQSSAIVFKGSGWYSTDHRSASDQSPGHTQKKHEAKSSPGDQRKD